jgi:hypothetical protein
MFTFFSTFLNDNDVMTMHHKLFKIYYNDVFFRHSKNII